MDIRREAHLHAQADMANLRPERTIQQSVIAHAQRDMAALGPEPPQQQQKSTAPSTASVLWASWRQGLKDLQTAVLGAWGGTHEEPGTIANPVPMEVYEDRHSEPARESPSYDQSLAANASRDERERGLTR